MRLMGEEYHFETRWTFDATGDEVWNVVSNICAYPDIWSDFKRVQLRVGDGHSVGSIIDAETRGSLPYSLKYTMEVVEASEPSHLLLKSTGDLVGTGRWELSPAGEHRTNVVYFWDVATTRRILNLLAPIAKPFLARNHDQVMARGLEAFTGELARMHEAARR
jgi:hypothetical protein